MIASGSPTVLIGGLPTARMFVLMISQDG